jgi:hypothetical protein
MSLARVVLMAHPDAPVAVIDAFDSPAEGEEEARVLAAEPAAPR